MRLGAQVAGRYRLLKGPVRGGTGEIWLARDEELGRSVVLKRVVPGDDSAAAFDRLKAEARALARFSHPHVVTVYDTVRVETRTSITSWLVLEHVPGGSLDRWPPISPEEAASIGAQIADALAALHTEGIVHCDVKPGNIVVTEKGTAKLTDFGAAYRIDDRTTITPNGAISHTPAYAAPEVIRGRPVPASDVFSLGVTIGALITGAPVREVAGHVSGPIRDVLAAMLRSAAEDRPDAGDAHGLLVEIAGTAKPQLPVHVVPTLSGPDAPPAEPGSESHRGRVTSWRGLTAFVKRRPRLIAAGAGVVALVTVLSLIPVIFDSDHHANASHAPTKSPPRSLIGEPRTADPCALTDPGPLGKYGRAEVVDDYGNFDRCDVLVRSGKNSVVDVEVDLDNEPAPEQPGPVKTVGGIRIAADQSEHDECSRILLLPPPDNDTNVTITVKQTETGPAPFCPMADAAAASAVKALGHGQIARRPPFPAGSLAQKNACTLLDADALNIVPGIDASEPDVGYGGWSCEWHSTTKDIQVKLRFDRNQPLTAEDGRATRLSGYRSFVQPRGDGDDTCLVQVVYRTYVDRDDATVVELVYLVVQGSPATARLCTMATGLAGSAAASLPNA